MPGQPDKIELRPSLTCSTVAAGMELVSRGLPPKKVEAMVKQIRERLLSLRNLIPDQTNHALAKLALRRDTDAATFVDFVASASEEALRPRGENTEEENWRIWGDKLTVLIMSEDATGQKELITHAASSLSPERQIALINKLLEYCYEGSGRKDMVVSLVEAFWEKSQSEEEERVAFLRALPNLQLPDDVVVRLSESVRKAIVVRETNP